jgi:hypothetical protein
VRKIVDFMLSKLIEGWRPVVLVGYLPEPNDCVISNLNIAVL